MLYRLVLASYQSSELLVALDSSYGAGVVVFSIDNIDCMVSPKLHWVSYMHA